MWAEGAEPNLSPYERPPFQLFMDMARIFGDVFHFGAMGKRYLVVSSLPLYKELWREAGVRMAGRAPFASVEFLNPRSLGDWKVCLSELQHFIRKYWIFTGNPNRVLFTITFERTLKQVSLIRKANCGISNDASQCRQCFVLWERTRIALFKANSEKCSLLCAHVTYRTDAHRITHTRIPVKTWILANRHELLTRDLIFHALWVTWSLCYSSRKECQTICRNWAARWMTHVATWTRNLSH